MMTEFILNIIASCLIVAGFAFGFLAWKIFRSGGTHERNRKQLKSAWPGGAIVYDRKTNRIVARPSLTEKQIDDVLRK